MVERSTVDEAQISQIQANKDVQCGLNLWIAYSNEF